VVMLEPHRGPSFEHLLALGRGCCRQDHHGAVPGGPLQQPPVGGLRPGLELARSEESEQAWHHLVSPGTGSLAHPRLETACRNRHSGRVSGKSERKCPPRLSRRLSAAWASNRATNVAARSPAGSSDPSSFVATASSSG